MVDQTASPVWSTKRKRLNLVVRKIQHRFGPKAVQRGVPASGQVSHIPTGFADLDKALDGIRGIPRGRLTEILSVRTAGAATLTLKVMATAQAEGTLATYLDLGATFDPDYAVRCQVQFSRSQFLLVNPDTTVEALEIAQTLIARHSTGVLVFDAVSPRLSAGEDVPRIEALLRQVPQALAGSNCALIVLTPVDTPKAKAKVYPPGFAALPYYASLRLLLRKERWLLKHNDIRGYESRAVVLNNKFGKSGRSARIAITFNGVAAGDST